MASISTICPTVPEKYDSYFFVGDFRGLEKGISGNAIYRSGKRSATRQNKLLFSRMTLRGQLHAVQPGGTVAHLKTAVNKPAYHQRINGVFLSLYTFRHVVFVVTVKDRYFCLQNDRTAVQLVGNEMHGGTMLLIAVLQHLTMGMQARYFGRREGWIFSKRPL